MSENAMPFSPGVGATPRVEAFLGRKLDTVQVSSKATLKDLQSEYDVIACGLLAIPPLAELPILEHAEAMERTELAMGFLECSYPITLGHAVVFGRQEFARLDYQLLLIVKGKLPLLLRQLNTSGVVDPQDTSKNLHLRPKTMLLSDVLQAVSDPQRQPQKIPINVVDVVGPNDAWVYAQHAPKKLPQLTLGRLTPLTRHGPAECSQQAFAAMLERFYAGDSDPYVARTYTTAKGSPTFSSLSRILHRPGD